MALGKPTAQSSTHSFGHSKNAVDGNTNPVWGGKSCIHTNKGYGQWWRVDLKRHYAVVKLRITNRKCCFGRMKNFEIRVGDSASNPQSQNHL